MDRQKKVRIGTHDSVDAIQLVVKARDPVGLYSFLTNAYGFKVRRAWYCPIDNLMDLTKFEIINVYPDPSDNTKVTVESKLDHTADPATTIAWIQVLVSWEYFELI